MSQSKKQRFHPYGLIVWTIAILFYLYEFFLRVLPASISADILHDLGITLVQFSMIASAYYITYAAMQLPVGILLDRYGVRILASFACLACALGMFGFAISDSFYTIISSRLLTGLGSSFGFISLLIIAFNWFPHRHFGFLSGLGQALGTAGPLLAGGPVVLIMNATHNDWKELFFWIAVWGCFLAVCMIIFIRNKPSDLKEGLRTEPPNRSILKDVKLLMHNPQIWITMLYTGSIYVTLPLLGAYWGTIYLQTRGFDKEVASFLTSLIWVGLAIGSPLFGFISDLCKRRKPVLIFLGILGIASSYAFLFFPTQSEWMLAALLLLIGISAGGQSLSFALIIEYVPYELRAAAIGANNTAVMSFAALLPPLVTFIIQSHVGTKHFLLPADFTQGLLLMPIAFAVATLISIVGIRETFCRPTYPLSKKE